MRRLRRILLAVVLVALAGIGIACLVYPPAYVYRVLVWADADPVRRTVEHPDFMGFAEEIGFVAAWERHGWPGPGPGSTTTRWPTTRTWPGSASTSR